MYNLMYCRSRVDCLHPITHRFCGHPLALPLPGKCDRTMHDLHVLLLSRSPSCAGEE